MAATPTTARQPALVSEAILVFMLFPAPLSDAAVAGTEKGAATPRDNAKSSGDVTTARFRASLTQIDFDGLQPA